MFFCPKYKHPSPSLSPSLSLSLHLLLPPSPLQTAERRRFSAVFRCPVTLFRLWAWTTTSIGSLPLRCVCFYLFLMKSLVSNRGSVFETESSQFWEQT